MDVLQVELSSSAPTKEPFLRIGSKRMSKSFNPFSSSKPQGAEKESKRLQLAKPKEKKDKKKKGKGEQTQTGTINILSCFSCFFTWSISVYLEKYLLNMTVENTWFLNAVPDFL